MAKAKQQGFRLASTLLAGSTLRPSVQVGMQAFLPRDRQLIALGERGRIADSLDLDEALRVAFPHSHRWDYVFSVSDAGTLLGLEPHHANDSEIRVVIAKKRHAAEQLRAHMPPRYRVSRWLWVSHGRTAFSRMESATRLLAQEGIEYLGRSVLNLG